MRDEGAGAKYCPSCIQHGIRTPVEKYRAMPMEFCTFHYWMMRGRPGGHDPYSLDEYVKSSKLHSFIVSLPSGDEMHLLQGDPRDGRT